VDFVVGDKVGLRKGAQERLNFNLKNELYFEIVHIFSGAVKGSVLIKSFRDGENIIVPNDELVHAFNGLDIMLEEVP